MQRHEIADVRIVLNDEDPAARLSVGLGRIRNRCHSSSLAPSRLSLALPPFFHPAAILSSSRASVLQADILCAQRMTFLRERSSFFIKFTGQFVVFGLLVSSAPAYRFARRVS